MSNIMQEEILLSICIPTYNRAIFLKELLESIETKHLNKIEVVISDNASSDNTEKVALSFAKKFPHFKYHKNEKNLGMDLNVLNVVNLAKGKYCWLFGDDDALFPHSIDIALSFLEKNTDLYLLNRISFDSTLTQSTEKKPWLDPSMGYTIFDIHNQKTFLEYLDTCQNLGGLLAFISSLIFKKERWEKTTPQTQFIGSFYVFVPTLLSFFQTKLTLCYPNAYLIKHRGENDRVLMSNLSQRYLLDAKQFNAFFHFLFKDKALFKAFDQVLTRHAQNVLFPKFRIALFVKAYSLKKDYQELIDYYSVDWKRSFYLKSARYFPDFFIKFLVFFKKRIFQRHSIART